MFSVYNQYSTHPAKSKARPKDFLTERTIFDGLLALLSYFISSIYSSIYSSLFPSSYISPGILLSLKFRPISIEKSLFFPLKNSRIMNGIYFIYLMNYPLAGIFVPSLKLAPGEIHLKFSGENRINWIVHQKQEVSKQIVIIGRRSSGLEISISLSRIYKLSSPGIT